MIRKFTFENWKSYRKAELPVEKLTVLIGTNASGKSNALDALEFLSRIVRATDIHTALIGDAINPDIRGGIEWASYDRGRNFSLTILVGGEDDKTDYEYSVTISVAGNVAELESEELVRIKYQGSKERRLRLFWTDEPEENAPGIIAKLYNTKAGTKLPLRRNISVLSQLTVYDLRTEIEVGVKQVSESLANIFILDPNPSSMRSYSRPSEYLTRDGSNVAGVLTALDSKRQSDIQKKITDYVRKIPEKDIISVWAETVDRHKVDAMLYCKEQWTRKNVREVDARGLSDGTLRFIAVIVALLTRPAGSMIVVEEIDNGLHPSRAVDLLNAMEEIGSERDIDLLVTTHNVALLDALSPGVLRSVAVATRDDRNGSSKITILDDLPYLSRLISGGSLGQLSAKGKVESGIKEQLSSKKKMPI
ncbi:AAA family ATPase [uncultured Jannaschia sp.]|uniref:AAA family ATPase n=1 Tax=uncultured Jannaschia sp. TaxID=293347 RepID=UPI00260C595D|nr:ATP-binding protein [uncultured Jannaschia sp.]